MRQRWQRFWWRLLGVRCAAPGCSRYAWAEQGVSGTDVDGARFGYVLLLCRMHLGVLREARVLDEHMMGQEEA